MIGQIIFESRGLGANRNASGKLGMKLAIGAVRWWVMVVPVSPAPLIISMPDGSAALPDFILEIAFIVIGIGRPFL